eukprot:TRINITY_DN37704_c0_g1_i1.p1 TRINITY_DN37704_c0_g1~~TRINITY_DN37704_c0_g1_i1.p1  ORF type:complete len:1138 (-),score=218.32 TRINITY_DN37704_c0_g1_i1:32-3445(-)
MGGRSGKQSVYEDDVSEAGSDIGIASPSSSSSSSRRVAPKAELLSADLSSKIFLSLRCEDLQRGKNSIVVVYRKYKEDRFWTEIGMSEVFGQDTTWPAWEKDFEIEFKVEKVHLVRAEVYLVRKPHMIEDLMEQKYVGAAEFVLTQAMMARANAKNLGWMTRNLEHHGRKKGGPPIGKIAVYAEEWSAAKTELFFKVRGSGMQSTDMWKRRCDPYFVVNRAEAKDDTGEVQLFPVFRSEVARKTTDPKFGQCRVTAAMTCGCLMYQDIIITVHDWFRLGGDRYIGECVINFDELQKGASRSVPMTLPVCRRDGPRIMGLTRVKTTAAQLRSATKASRSGSRGRSATASSSRGRPSKDSGEQSRTSSSKEGSGGLLGGVLRGSEKRTSSRISGGSAGSAESPASRKASHLSSGSNMSASTFNSAGTHNTGGSRSDKSFGPQVASLTLEDFGFIRRYSFLDYVRGGLELRLNVAIDFTRSNLGQRNPMSSHSTVNKDDETAYARAIRALGEVIETYDNDNMYPVYGFGAKIPPSYSVVSNCFALTGDFFEPEVEGIDGILLAYQRALQVCHLHGPTRLAEIIRLCGNLARPYVPKISLDPKIPPSDMKFFVMVILTDGEIEDQEQTVQELKACIDLPVSIIFVGIGNADFSFLKELEREMRSLFPKKDKKDKDDEEINSPMQRDLVRFVAFEEYRDFPEEMASQALKGLPKEVISYYSERGIKPYNLDKFEDAQGNSYPRQVPPVPIRAQKNQAITQVGANRQTSEHSSPQTSRAGTQLGRSSKSPGSSKSPNSSQPQSRAASRSTEASSAFVRLGDDGGSEADGSDFADLLNELDEQDEEEKRKKERLEAKQNMIPVFLLKEKERLVEDGIALGYEKTAIQRVIRDGIPSAGLDVLVDNIMNAGYGKENCYKDAAAAAIPGTVDESAEMNIPGQVQDTVSPASSAGLLMEKLNALQKSGQSESPSSRLGLLAGSRTATASRSRAGSVAQIGAFASPSSAGTAAGSKEKISDPWANVKVEDGSAARTLLEVSAKRRSREPSKELENLSGATRGTTKTLEEVAGRLGGLRTRTMSHGLSERRPSMGSVEFHTIREDDFSHDEEPASSSLRNAAKEDMTSPSKPSVEQPKGDPLVLEPVSP